MNRNEGPIEKVPTKQDFLAERLELETVLATLLGRSSNLKRLLGYICERYFDGQAAEIKEYSIAVDAFGRPPEFDPTVDSIVRVEAHRLRSKLARYYRQEGAGHRVQIVLPVGGYVPQFIHLLAGEVSASHDQGHSQSPLTLPPEALPEVSPAALAVSERAENMPKAKRWLPTRSAFGVIAGIVFLFLAAFAVRHFTKSDARIPNVRQVDAPARPTSELYALTAASRDASSGIRIMCGADSQAVTDQGGEIWMGDRYFQGGQAALTSPKTLDFTTTPSLYVRRRRGNFSYAIPLRKGIYELKLHFADAFFGHGNPDEGGESSRLFDVKINGKPLLSDFDVIADAGGPNTADIKIFSDIEPAADGYLHLDFISLRNVAFVNAIEVLPDPSRKMLPIRIYAGLSDYKDSAGTIWNADRYFRGGVHLHQATSQSAVADSDARFGNFVYQLPVAEGAVYTARLRFCPIDIANPQPAGSNSNIFNVYLNGTTLLKNFTISARTKQPACIVKQFTGIKSSAQGKLSFSFVPIRGYASVNSIAIDEE